MVEKSEVVEVERGWSTEEGGMLSLNVFLSSPSVLIRSERLGLAWRLPARLRGRYWVLCSELGIW